MYLIPLGLIVINAVTQAMNMPEEGVQGGGQTQQSAAAIQRGPGSAVQRRWWVRVTCFIWKIYQLKLVRSMGFKLPDIWPQIDGIVDWIFCLFDHSLTITCCKSPTVGYFCLTRLHSNAKRNWWSQVTSWGAKHWKFSWILIENRNDIRLFVIW